MRSHGPAAKILERRLIAHIQRKTGVDGPGTRDLRAISKVCIDPDNTPWREISELVSYMKAKATLFHEQELQQSAWGS
jgi:hypothetical protein